VSWLSEMIGMLLTNSVTTYLLYVGYSFITIIDPNINNPLKYVIFYNALCCEDLTKLS